MNTCYPEYDGFTENIIDTYRLYEYITVSEYKSRYQVDWLKTDFAREDAYADRKNHRKAKRIF